MKSRKSVTFVGVFLAGALVGGGIVVGITNASGHATVDATNPPYTVTSTSGAPVNRTSNSTTAHAGQHGWLIQAMSGSDRVVYYDQLVIHNRDQPINVTLDSEPLKGYKIDISAPTGGNASGERVQSWVRVSVTLPSDYRSIRVVVDGRTIREFENGGQTALQFHRLNRSVSTVPRTRTVKPSANAATEVRPRFHTRRLSRRR